ncbi:FAD-binding oxidoreductase [Alkalihalobacillus pseudalcaliphilus]|nr:FAD-binding oxidoreductase [Alkalihalobacillus pseudalcaliphilus]
MPASTFYPESIEDVRTVIKKAKASGKKVRVVGAGHSFTPLANCDDYLMCLDRLKRIESIDVINQTVTVQAGIRLSELGDELAKQGFAQENLGDINVQSLAGAISTGTHGTGIQFGNIPSQVEELTLVTATGELLTCSKEKDQELFQASLISLGLFGVIVKVKLRIIKAPVYDFRSEKVTFEQLQEQLPKWIEENTHFEFFMFPFSEYIQTKKMKVSSARPQSVRHFHRKNVVIENYLFYLVSEVCRLYPKSSKRMSQLSAKSVSKQVITANSYDLFTTPRKVKFVEMEYAIPIEALQDALDEIQKKIKKEQFQVHFPIECRMVAADESWLSPSYQRKSAYLAFHMYKGMPFESYFYAMETIMDSYAGRPHWGKWHSKTKKDLEHLYPKFAAFLKTRNSLDPEHIFINDYLRQLILGR